MVLSETSRYFVGRLLNFAHGRRAAPLLGYEAMCRKMKDVDLSKIRQISDLTYAVPSATQVGVEYTIEIDLGICTCPVGCSGAFCKHQAALHKKCGVMLPNLPPINPRERFALAQLALGEKCPHPDFFKVCPRKLISIAYILRIKCSLNKYTIDVPSRKIGMPIL